MIKNPAYLLGQIVLHIIAVGLIVWAFWPIAKWYINYRPVWGVDFFLLANLTKILSLNFVPPFAFWDYAGFSGWPAFFYPSLHTYIAYFFSRAFDLILGIQIWMMVSTALFVVGSYALFFMLSRNFILALILAIATAYSGGVYQTLTWAGSLPSFATQAAFPWALFFLVWYFRSGKIRQLLAASLVAGISIWGHPLVFVVYILPATLILILFRFNRGLAIISKFKAISIYLFLVILLGLPLFATTFKSAAKQALRSNYGVKALSTTSAPSQYEIIEAQFNKAQVKRAVTDNHVLPFFLLGTSSAVFLLGIIAVRKKAPILASLPFLVMALYFSIYIWLFGQGISIYHGGWYRLFWSVPVWVGACASVLWGEAFASVSGIIGSRIVKLILTLGSNTAILLIGLAFLYAHGSGSAIVSTEYRSQVSSAYPDMINLRVSAKESEGLKQKLLPEWMDADDTNWRFYDGDQTINLWWSAFFKMPLARGYLDPPIDNSKRGYIFLLDSALSQADGEPQLMQAFSYPKETAISNALFLVDWNAVKFYEGGHEGTAFTPLPNYLKDYLVKKTETVDLNEGKYTHRPVTLTYTQFNDDVVSPILSATNAPALGVFATEGGFETVVRAIAERENINSQKLIPVNLGRNIDDYSFEELKNFEALYLYDWDFKKSDRAFKLLNNYVLLGRKIFVETGVEVKLSGGQLPDLFPVKNVERRGLGREWGLEAGEGILTRNVNFENFAPPIFDDTEWKLSFAQDSELRSGAMTILKNHGKIVMASQKLGSGEVIWSGLNFAYHLNRNHNGDEAKFFLNILSYMLDISRKSAPSFQAIFKNPNTREVETEGARGILFKEMAYDGWLAQEVDSGKKLKIYKAGPAYPGFMYIPLPKDVQKVRISFGGSLFDIVVIGISLILVIFVFEEVALHGLVLGRARRFALLKFLRHLGRWWEKEEE